jgi:hypothetical protein
MQYCIHLIDHTICIIEKIVKTGYTAYILQDFSILLLIPMYVIAYFTIELAGEATFYNQSKYLIFKYFSKVDDFRKELSIFKNILFFMYFPRASEYLNFFSEGPVG